MIDFDDWLRFRFEGHAAMRWLLLHRGVAACAVQVATYFAALSRLGRGGVDLMKRPWRGKKVARRRCTGRTCKRYCICDSLYIRESYEKIALYTFENSSEFEKNWLRNRFAVT